MKDEKLNADKTAVAVQKEQEEMQYWLKILGEDFKKSNFPSDFPDVKTKTTEFKYLEFEIENEIFSSINKLSKGSDLKLQFILNTALFILIRKHSFENDISIGTSIYKQTSGANFINTILVLRNNIDEKQSVKELLLKTKDIIIEANKNPNYPLEHIIKKLKIPYEKDDFYPFFDIGIILENLQTEDYLSKIKFNLLFSFSVNNDSLSCKIKYNSNFYKDETIVKLFSFYSKVLESFYENIDKPLAEIDLINDEDKYAQLQKYNETKANYSDNKTIIDLFEAQVEKSPENIALEFQGQRLNYRDLNNKSNQLAHLLKSKGAEVGSRIGIMLNRSIDSIVAILATLKVGGVYVPIDKNYPNSRKQYLIEDSELSILLSHSELITKNINNLQGIPSNNLLDMSDPNIYSGSCENIEIKYSSNDPAYIIYTSGSTGIPKGVVIAHSSLINYVQWGINHYIDSQEVSMPLYTSMSFDLTISSIYLPLLSGNKIIIYPEGEVLEILEDMVLRDQVNIIKATPSHLRVFSQLLEKSDSTMINKFIVGGELLDSNLCRKITEKNPEVIIYNEYGPTEATVGCMIYKYDNNNETNVPIGLPINNTQVYILDKYSEQLKPIGIPGELCVSGVGLAKTYLNKEQLTNEKFIAHPFIEGEKLYRTGDLARWLPNGNMDFIGRIDDQVKIRGFRIELGEIENAINKNRNVENCVVIVREENDDKYLCAYLEGKEQFNQAELQAYLKNSLPDYMIPSYFVELDSLPLNSNGKINKTALPAPEMKVQQEYLAPANETEEKLVKIWSDLFKIPQEKLSTNVNFFEIGGHSLKATILTDKVHKEFGVNIPLVKVFEAPTILEYAMLVFQGMEMEKVSEEVEV